MSARILTVAAAQLGPIGRHEPRSQVVARLIELMKQAKSMGAQLVVYPELALTTFFPRWYEADLAAMEVYFESEMPGADTRILFETAQRLEVGFYLGYAERVEDPVGIRRFNTSILVDPRGGIVGKYRKVHLPGHADDQPWRAFQHLEKRYFEVGDLGFPVWQTMGGWLGMCICNDRRWPETYRVMGLQGVEMILLGYNTPVHNPPAPEHDSLSHFHNHLSMQSGAYQNSTWVVGVAKAGREEGCDLIGQSAIIAPSGEIVAMTRTLGDELAVARCDLDAGRSYRETVFDFARHRQTQHYQRIAQQIGIELPE